ncbi:hypothetical protein XpopCFBP1817_20350 [Xanthomonas populi]|uniref:Uncharacterized protein n=1 Tax=Xanthomonas populi TaxID=53414 RepID=A0A2S7E353_9XANT|nr:hypothetical protein XpopCFBP1817_20350 [Xanthomonas populi]
MDKEDASNQTLDRLHERRKQGVRLQRLGHGVMQIAKLTGLSSPQECGMTLSVRGVGTYLARSGFTPQTPLNKADE